MNTMQNFYTQLTSTPNPEDQYRQFLLSLTHLSHQQIVTRATFIWWTNWW